MAKHPKSATHLTSSNTVPNETLGFATVAYNLFYSWYISRDYAVDKYGAKFTTLAQHETTIN